MLRKFLVFLLFCSIFIPTALAQEGEIYHVKLLAVQEGEQDYQGSDADLFLELKEGSGRVFLETFPLTKFDTQISTRFAKDIACNHFNLNCDKYDFIYTIKAKTNIIGGPSAGAAVAALTTIAVLDLPYEENIAITGTINSGGIIGPVGGVKEKLEAAAHVGINKVLIPKGADVSATTPTLNTSNASNEISEQPFDLISYGQKNLSIEVIEVLDLDQVIFHFTGRQLDNKTVDVVENEQYQEIMRKLQEALCQRTEKIKTELIKENVILANETEENIVKKQRQAENATQQEDFYSAASFCFGNNIELKTNFYQQKQPNRGMVAKLFTDLEKKTKTTEQQLEQEEIETISDLQTYMIVKERLYDVKEQLQQYQQQPDISLEEAYTILAYSEERYFSAISWMEFFAMDGKKYLVDRQKLQLSCEQKISEAEERHQYASLFIGPTSTIHIQDKITAAKQAFQDREFALCLITAAQAKADANAILSTIGVSEEALLEFVESKQKAVEKIIAENSAEETFPILGYSYYQYANSLKQTQPATALVYLEYALEMSDLGIYFPEEKEFLEIAKGWKMPREWIYFGIGLLLGGAVMLLIMISREKRHPPRYKKIQANL